MMDSFDSELGPIFRSIRATRGACPDPDQIVSAVCGALGASEAQTLNLHARECGRCDALLTRLKDADRRLREERPPLRLFLAHWAFAYISAALLVFAAALYFRTASRTAPPAPAAFQPAQYIALAEATRGSEATRINGSGNVLLGFVIPAQPRHAYFARVISETGETVAGPIALPSAGADGGMYVTLDRSGLLPGRYRLAVTEKDPAGGETGRIFEFRLRM